MSRDDIDRDLREAVEARLAARLAGARRRRAERERTRRDKQARRDAGLRSRHRRKLSRTESR